MSFAAIANLVVFVLLAALLFNFRKPRLNLGRQILMGLLRGRLRPCPAVPLRQRRCRRERDPHLDQRSGLGLHQLAQDGHHATRTGDDDCRRGAHARGGGSWTHRRQRGGHPRGTTAVAALVGIFVSNFFGLSADAITQGARELERAASLTSYYENVHQFGSGRHASALHS